MGHIIRNHKEFVKYINEKVDINMNYDTINEVVSNDVTLSNSLLGQLFGAIFRKVSGRIKKGKIKGLVDQLANEFAKGQYKAVSDEKIAKKITLYSTILNLKRDISKENVDIDKFDKKLNEAIETLRDLVKGEGKAKIEDPELLETAKEFYNDLKEIAGLDIDDISKDDVIDTLDDEDLEDEDITIEHISCPKYFNQRLTEVTDNDLKKDFIIMDIERQIKTDNALYESNGKLVINESVRLSEADLINYFNNLNIHIEYIHEGNYIDILSFDKKNNIEYLIKEFNNTSNPIELKDVIFDFSEDLGDMLYAPVTINGTTTKVNGVGMSTQSDVEAKGQAVYKAIMDAVKGNVRASGKNEPINLLKLLNKAKATEDKRLIRSMEKIIGEFNKFKNAKNDDTGLKNSFTSLVRYLNEAHTYVESIVSKIEKRASQKRKEDKESKGNITDTGVRIPFNEDDIAEVNTKYFSKLGDSNTVVKYKNKKGEEKKAYINPNQPKDIEEKIGYISLISLDKKKKFAIKGDNITEIGGVKTPKGIVNKEHLEERKRRELKKEDKEKWIEESKYLFGSDIEYYVTDSKTGKRVKDENGEFITKKGTVAPYKVQVEKITEPGALWVTYDKGQGAIVKNILDRIKSKDGEDFSKGKNKERLKLLFEKKFPNTEEYEKEVRLSERQKRDLKNIISDKAKNNNKLIDPIEVLRIFNKAHNLYTVENYDNIPDGSQGSSIQGKGKGVNKKKNYKKMSDGSGRHTGLFNEWNDAVLSLIKEYEEYIPEVLKKFIIEILDNNKMFNSGAQAKLLQNYFDVKADLSSEDLGLKSKGSSEKDKEKEKTESYVATDDTDGHFTEPIGNSLQMKKENFEKLPFILEGTVEGSGDVSYVSYYMGTIANEYILFKFKSANADFLNNYKREEQRIDSPENLKGQEGENVYYGVMTIPSGNNKSLSIGDTINIWFTDVRLQEDVKALRFKVKDLYYLTGKDDGNIMRLDTKRPNEQHGDYQIDDIKKVHKKFENYLG